MLKDKEVVSDPQRQYEIARQVHAQQHGGINKTTATIAEKYHWVRIKETVSLVIKNCPDCKESAAKAPTVRPMGESAGGAMGQLRKAAGVNGQTNDPNSMIERLVNFDDLAPSSTPSDNRALSISRTPEMEHTAPVANMRALQEYVDIPLDPQIMQQHQHHPHQQRLDNGTQDVQYDPRMSNIDDHRQYEMDLAPLQHHNNRMRHGDDTRMATERHVREGDDPIAFQDGSGMLHDDTDESRQHGVIDLENDFDAVTAERFDSHN